MTICLLVCFLTRKYYWLDLLEKKTTRKMGLGPTQIPLKFKSCLYHHLDTEKLIQILTFIYYYVPFVKVCSLSVCATFNNENSDFVFIIVVN